MRIKYLAILLSLFFIIISAISSFLVRRTNINPSSNYIPSLSKSAITENVISKASLDSIFRSDHAWIATLSAQRIRKILVTGDIIPARSVNNGVVVRNNPKWPYEKVAEKIYAMKPDSTFINLETPLIKKCSTTIEGMIFCGTDKNIEGLKFIRVDVASVANNHFGNHGIEGIQESMQLLKDNDIAVAGTNGPVYKNIRGVIFAFLAYNDIGSKEEGIAWADKDTIKNEIAEAKARADVVLVMFHWGIEYQSQPDEKQKELAHFTIDHGADLVVSNHPHWIQPVEFYKGKVIMYAHGNFIFDQMWSQKTREGVLGLYTFYDKELIDIEFFPLQINDYGQAVFLAGDQKEKILKELKEQSEVRSKSLKDE